MKRFGSRWQKKNPTLRISGQRFILTSRSRQAICQCRLMLPIRVASCVSAVMLCRRVESWSVSFRCQEWHQVSLPTHQGQTGDSLNNWWNILDTHGLNLHYLPGCFLFFFSSFVSLVNIEWTFPSFSCIPTQREIQCRLSLSGWLRQGSHCMFIDTSLNVSTRRNFIQPY